MLNKFCFHVYAEKSLFIAENCNGFFLTPAREFGTHRAGSQLKKCLKQIKFSSLILLFSCLC